MRHSCRTSWIVVTSLIVICATTAIATESTPTVLQANQTLASRPIAFTKNMGQWPDSILFRADAGGVAMWFTKDGIYYQYARRILRVLSIAEESLLTDKFGWERDSVETTMIKAEFVGANPDVEVIGLEELEYKCNYFIGNNPAKWRTDVPNFSGITVKNLLPGVDVSFRAKDGRLEYQLSGPREFSVDKLQVQYRGGEVIEQDDGSVVLRTELGDKVFLGMLPVDESVPQSSRSSITTSAASAVTIAYSTYLGGESNDGGSCIAVDGSGNAYVTGYTNATSFPTQNPYQTDQGLDDVFVTKLSADGNSLLYSTYLGGDSTEAGSGIAVDGSGNVYVTGYTYSTDFPTQNPYQTDQGGTDVFVTKLSASGNSLLYSTYLGGGSYDYGRGIAVDGTGNAHVTGETESTNFPTQSPYLTDQGSQDVFVTKLSAAGNSLHYSTYLGGGDADYGYGISVDGSGSAYVTGYTNSTNFPTQNPYQTDQGLDDVFVTKLSAAGNSLLYSTYLGGESADRGEKIAVDGSGNAYVTGYTNSADFPTRNPYQTDQGVYDAFVTKLSADGNNLLYSTYLGGGSIDWGRGIAVDGSGNAYVTGFTLSSDFPTLTPYQADQGFDDVFVTKLSAAGNNLLYSSYLGGGSGDLGFGIAVDGSGSAYVTGDTWSTNFPTQNPYQTDPGDLTNDVFVTKIMAPVSCCQGVTGNLDADPGDVCDPSDLQAIVDFIFFNVPLVSTCAEENDLTGDAVTDPSDLQFLVDYIFFNLADPPPCGVN